MFWSQSLCISRTYHLILLYFLISLLGLCWPSWSSRPPRTSWSKGWFKISIHMNPWICNKKEHRENSLYTISVLMKSFQYILKQWMASEFHLVKTRLEWWLLERASICLLTGCKVGTPSSDSCLSVCLLFRVRLDCLVCLAFMESLDFLWVN